MDAVNSPRPRYAAILDVSPELLTELLHLPKGSQVWRVEQRIDRDCIEVLISLPPVPGYEHTEGMVPKRVIATSTAHGEHSDCPVFQTVIRQWDTWGIVAGKEGA